jgi:predicted O-linked N-acetylglucosamine transferase (SPINDLY family)
MSFIHQSTDAKYIAPMLLLSHYDYKVDKQALFDMHRLWGRKIEEKCKGNPLRNYLQDGFNGRIRIGYLSPDFREHSVGYFVHNIIENHDKSQFQVFCYSNCSSDFNDWITRKIRGTAFQFLDVQSLTDRDLAMRIRDDGIHILIDLAGHTTNSRLTVLGFRPAPIQITYLGYPGTTGLQTVDYRITDYFAESESGNIYTEKLIRLPECFLSFGEFASQNIAEGPAVERKGYVTFGSFNSISKITPETVRVWSAILRKVPSSKLVIKAPGCRERCVMRHVASEFKNHHVPIDRLELVDFLSSKKAHLDYYNEIDIALDTFPYNGTTTTCEALWMGVPVVTWVGEAHCQRVAYSILKNVGLDNLIASTEDEYIGLAVQLAKRQIGLQEVRQIIPKLIRDSIVCRPDRLTKQLEEEFLRLVKMRSKD